VFISGLGAYKSYLNGRATDPHELSTFTVYEHRVEYDVWDVTEHVHSGCNALGVLIGVSQNLSLHQRLMGLQYLERCGL
jgi:alpha-L-rhamnosidase